MESPQEIETDIMPPIPLCVHEIHPEMTIGRGPDGTWTKVTFAGHDEHGTDMAVTVHLPGCLMDALSVRLQEFQISATLTGMGEHQPGLFKQIRRAVLDRRPAGGHSHDH
jgi:hypothetical protein